LRQQHFRGGCSTAIDDLTPVIVSRAHGELNADQIPVILGKYPKKARE
jgi:hypothetical protein